MQTKVVTCDEPNS